jgi:hypothetical protein
MLSEELNAAPLHAAPHFGRRFRQPTQFIQWRE